MNSGGDGGWNVRLVRAAAERSGAGKGVIVTTKCERAGTVSRVKHWTELRNSNKPFSDRCNATQRKETRRDAGNAP